MTPSCPVIPTPSLRLSPDHRFNFHMRTYLSLPLSRCHTLLCSSLSKQHVCRGFRRMHLVTQMSHTSSGLHASPSGWMNERAERLAGGGAQWLRRRGLCQLLNVIKKKVSVCVSHRAWDVHIGAVSKCCCPSAAAWLTALTRLSHRLQKVTASIPPLCQGAVALGGKPRASAPQRNAAPPAIWEICACPAEGNVSGGMKRLQRSLHLLGWNVPPEAWLHFVGVHLWCT